MLIYAREDFSLLGIEDMTGPRAHVRKGYGPTMLCFRIGCAVGGRRLALRRLRIPHPNLTVAK
jgi:hypothetical protein